VEPVSSATAGSSRKQPTTAEDGRKQLMSTEDGGSSTTDRLVNESIEMGKVRREVEEQQAKMQV